MSWRPSCATRRSIGSSPSAGRTETGSSPSRQTPPSGATPSRPLPVGPVAMISQSGNVAVNALSSRRGINFHTVISTGNAAVCDPADWLLAAVRARRGGLRRDVPRVRRGRRRSSRKRSRAAPSAGSAWPCSRSGASEAGAAAAAAHTGALAGDQRIFRALDRGGRRIVGAEPARAARTGAGPRRATGAAARRRRAWRSSPARAATRESPPTRRSASASPCRRSPTSTAARLRDLLPDAATVGNPLDYTPLIWGDKPLLQEIVETTGSDPGIDQVLVFHDTPLDLPADSVESWADHLDGIAAGLERADAAPLLASTMPELIDETIARELGAQGHRISRRGNDRDRLRARATPSAGEPGAAARDRARPRDPSASPAAPGSARPNRRLFFATRVCPCRRAGRARIRRGVRHARRRGRLAGCPQALWLRTSCTNPRSGRSRSTSVTKSP